MALGRDRRGRYTNSRVQIAIGVVTKGAERGFKKIKSGLSGVGKLAKTIFSPSGLVLGGLAGFGLGKLAGSFIETASSFEGLEASLTTTLGSLDKAREAISYANKEAAASPYTVLEYGEAIRTLSAYGVDYTKVMQSLGDTAAAMNKPLQQAVEALADAMQGEGERLKEFGIKQKVAGDLITYTWVDTMGKVRETVAKNSPEIIQQTLTAIWNEKYQGGMAKFGSTWKGLTSTAKSLWDEFKLAVMDSGPFLAIKTYLQGVIDKVNELKQGGQFKGVAEKIGQTVVAWLQKIVKAIPLVVKLILKGVEEIVISFLGWKMLISQLQIAFLSLEISFLSITRKAREFGQVAKRALELASLIPGVGSAASALRISTDDLLKPKSDDELAKERDYIAALEERKNKVIQAQMATMRGVDANEKRFDGYQKSVDGLGKTFEELNKKIDATLEQQKAAAGAAAEASKQGSAAAVSAIESEEAAIERLISKYRQLNEAAGRRGGSFSTASFAAEIENAERTE